MSRHFTVVGAGIVGTCCALSLARDGHRVTLIDRDEPGTGCSFGNAAMIQTGHCVPMATPGILRKVPGMLLDPKAPLVIRWKHLARLTPWLMRLAREATPSRMDRNAAALAALLGHAKAAHLDLVGEADAEALIRHRGELYVYRSRAAFDAARADAEYRRARGVVVEELTGGALRQMEPALARDVDYGYYQPDSLHTVSPLRLTQAYADAFQRLGGKIQRAEILDIDMGPDGPRALRTPTGPIEVDELVIATGAFSGPFAKRLGLKVPLESARGYHLALSDPGVELKGPVLDGEIHFGVIPMADGVRLAGTIEFASLTEPPNDARADMLLPMAKALIPSLRSESGVRWMGHRPAIPDSLPVIGRAPHHKSVYLAFGHGQLGLTLGAVTGRMIAEIAAGRETAIDPTPYRADRF